MEAVYHRIDTLATGQLAGPAADAFEHPHHLDRSHRRQLKRLLEKLVADGIDANVAETIGEFVAHAALQDIARIRPLALANRLALDPVQVTAACLHGAREGLFVLLWDILCPVCRIPSQVIDTLRRCAHSNCAACNLDFELDFSNSIEIIFRVHPEIRDSELATYCIGGPAHSPHVTAQIRLAPGESIEMNLSLPEGAVPAARSAVALRR